jgi:hypothetical protein
MIAIGRRTTSQQTRRERVFPTGAIGAKSEWMMTGEDPKFSPTVFLYEQPANQTLAAHFHHNNEFQVFIEGSGKVGARVVEPVTVHYAGAYTAYGPIVAGPAGLKYFTIRTVHESGAVLVSKAQGKWPAGPRRQATSKPFGIRCTGQLESIRESNTAVILPLDKDGLSVTSVELPPRTALSPTSVGAGDGAFLLVLAGSLLGAEAPLNEYESLYATVDAELPALRAGERGAHLLVLIPPQRDPAYS